MNVEEKETNQQEGQEEQEQNQPASEVGSFDESLERYEDQGNEGSSEEQGKETPQKEEETCETCGGGEEGTEEKKDIPLKLVGKDGKETPLVFKVNGKEYIPDTPDKVLNWGNMGINSNTLNEQTKKEKAELEKAKPIVDLLAKAYKEGRIKVDDQSIGPGQQQQQQEGQKPEEGEEEEDYEDMDPDVATVKKENQQLKKDIENIKGSEQKRKEAEMRERIDKARNELKSEIGKHVEKYPAVLDRSQKNAPKDVWDYLAMVDENDQPKHNPETAAKASHESMVNFVKDFVKNHPNEVIDEEEIYVKKLKEKQQNEQQPVSPPNQTSAGSPGQKKGRRGDIKNLDDAFEKFSQDLAKSKQASNNM